MDTFEKELKKIQRRDWQIWTLVLTVLLILTAFIVLVVFYSDLQRLYQEQIDAQMFNFLLLGFVALSLLFIGYVLIKEIAIKKLQRDLITQQMDSRMLERKVTELQAVQELNSVVNSEMLLSEVFDTITSKALSTLGGDQCSLFLYDPEIDKLRCVSVWGPKSDRVKDAIVEIGKSVAGWVIEHGEPLYLDGDLKEGQFRELIKKDKKISSSLCLPLKVKNETKGVLNISLFGNEKKFSKSDLSLAARFAEHAALAIDKAGLYDELKKQTKTLKNIVSEMKGTPEQFIRPETLRALSNLTSGMSHEFNNTLTAMMDKIHLISKKVGEASIPENDKQNVLKWLEEMRQLASDGTETARHIQVFARTFQEGWERDLKGLDVNAIVREVVETTKPKWKDEAELKGIRIEIQTDLEELSTPTGNPAEIKDVLTSMIYNSIDALPHGGKINISTRMRSGDRPSGRDGRVEIKVMDNGSGMTQEVKRRVFEPFFTTKTEKGHGISLSVAQGIISQHNGEIEAESEPDVCTIFTITLPVSGDEEAQKKNEAETVTAATP